MTILEQSIFVVGLVVVGIGSAGVVGALAVWATNQVLEATRYGTVIVRWYADDLRSRKTRG